MTQERQADATADTTGSTGDAAEQSGGQTVEEVEAFWRNRTSGIQRAHNAETADLHRQMDEMRKAPVAAPEGESAEAARVRALEAELQQERAARQAADLKSQYPYAADILGDEITSVTPAKLAAINAAGDTGSAPIINPNAAARGNGSIQQPAAKPMNEKSKDELLADLQRIAPAYQEAAKEGLL